jgi:hypothetical protein
MCNDLCVQSVIDLIVKKATEQAAIYRKQARRRTAEAGEDDEMVRGLLQLAEKYDALAKGVLVANPPDYRHRGRRRSRSPVRARR